MRRTILTGHPVLKGVPDNLIAKHTRHKRKALERYKHLFPQIREETVQLIDSEVKIEEERLNGVL